MSEFSSPVGLVLGTDTYGRATLFKRCITTNEDGEPIDYEPFLEPIFVYEDSTWHFVGQMGRGKWETVELFISSDLVNDLESVDEEFLKPKDPNVCKKCAGTKYMRYWINGQFGKCPDCNKEVQA